MKNLISFNGVDERTDINRLVAIQKRFPLSEFGIILSNSWDENGNRYIDPHLISRFKGLGLNLSAHLCGSIAREAVRDNWEPALELCGGNFDMFSRVQLNIARYDNNPDILHFNNIPGNIQEVIIQQKSANECELFREYNKRTEDPRVVVLVDASGGEGKSHTAFELTANVALMNDVKSRVGFAGGINHHNVINTIRLIEDVSKKDYWIDMESGLRTDDWFDLDKVSAVCGLVYGYMNMIPTSC